MPDDILEFMATKALGSGAKHVSAADRARWIAAFGNFMVGDYARRFEGFHGQRFETLGETPAPHEQVVVQTRVVRPDHEDVRLDYRLRETPEGWRIIDLYAKGTTSMLSVRRAEFSYFLEAQGIEALIASVDQAAAAP